MAIPNVILNCNVDNIVNTFVNQISEAKVKMLRVNNKPAAFKMLLVIV